MIQKCSAVQYSRATSRTTLCYTYAAVFKRNCVVLLYSGKFISIEISVI